MSDEFSQGQSEAIRPLLVLLSSIAFNDKQKGVLVDYIETQLLPSIKEHGSSEKIAGAESILLFVASTLKDFKRTSEGDSEHSPLQD